MATIKPIEGRSIHQIQSGQVIVDLCSVVKELVENSLDAGATSIDVRLRNNGLDSIEVQDNGHGIAAHNYETLALKHYTSKLSTYDDLNSLQTFGFRGEALSSLCALSDFHVITAQASEVPKGTRLDFETSGRLKETTVVASQKGTTVVVQRLFKNLPVRRRELEKNIKREYSKLLGLLQAYACISVGVRFSVSNQAAKGKKATAFSTNANVTTKENIANVYGAKTLLYLIPLDLKLKMQSSRPQAYGVGAKLNQQDVERPEVRIIGHVSRPVFGEGRQTPDRQMFFVNSRPCALPQFAKAFNEVYKPYNTLQSPFIFANLRMDTNAYDVNVSPDKRTILMHNQDSLLEALKSSLSQLFEAQDQTVPLSQRPMQSLPPFRQLSISRQASLAATDSPALIESPATDVSRSPSSASGLNSNGEAREELDRYEANTGEVFASSSQDYHVPNEVQDFNDRIASQQARRLDNAVTGVPMYKEQNLVPTVAPTRQRSSPSIVQSAFDRMRLKRTAPEVATITIGSKTTTSMIGSSGVKKRMVQSTNSFPKIGLFERTLRTFSAPGTQLTNSQAEVDADELAEGSERGLELEDFARRVPSNDHLGNSSCNSSDIITAGDVAFYADEGSLSLVEDQESDGDYLDESETKAQEDARVADLILEAEMASSISDEAKLQRATNVLFKGKARKESTFDLVKYLDTSVPRIEAQLQRWTQSLHSFAQRRRGTESTTGEVREQSESQSQSPEDRLSLTVSKPDFARMRVVGQFNLGFILAARPSKINVSVRSGRDQDELFIIDQHASDEKRKFERLQAETVVQNQRLVQPRTLDLTAIEEETILSHPDALSRNGFVIEVDTSGESPIGKRCKLIALPMSREVLFDTRDLEELLALLLESSGSTNPDDVPRPSKVRRMFAMRACRSSVMVGKTLTAKQMEGIVRRMGEIDKPWNCPHGRPTIRHVISLGSWESWEEGDGLVGLGKKGPKADWARYVKMNGVVREEVGKEAEADEYSRYSLSDEHDEQVEVADLFD